MATYFSQLHQTLAEELPGPLQDAMGGTVTYRVKAGPTDYTVIGLLAEPDRTEQGFPGSNTGLKVHESQMETVTPVRGDEVVMLGSTYTVWDVDKTAIGFWLLALRKQ